MPQSQALGAAVKGLMHMEGSCVCGATHYKVTGAPLSVHACHCTDCQTLSGSAFSLSMILNQENIELTAGMLDINKFSTSHNKMHRHHCSECGTAIWFSSPDYPGIIALKPGTLNDTSTLSPIAHVWYRSAQPWLDVGNNIPVYQEQPPLSELLELASKTHGT
jgi:hypothetical protein